MEGKGGSEGRGVSGGGVEEGGVREGGKGVERMGE